MASRMFKLTVANPRFWVALPVVIGVFLPLLVTNTIANGARFSTGWLADRLWEPVRVWMHKGVRHD